MSTGIVKRWNHLTTGELNLDAKVAGTVTGGPSLDMSLVRERTLSALVSAEAETNTITITMFWQISNDNVNFYSVVLPNNATTVTWGTGTAGDDAAVQQVLQAPDAVYGAKYARVAVVNGVVQGTANDKYTIGYNFAQAGN